MPSAPSKLPFRRLVARLTASTLLLTALAAPMGLLANPTTPPARAISQADLARLRAELRSIQLPAGVVAEDAAGRTRSLPAVGGAERANIVVELSAPSVIEAYSLARTRDRARADRTAAAQLGRVEREQDRLSAALASVAPDAEEIYRVQRVYNGVALNVDVDSLEAIAAIPGVKSIKALVPKHRDNSSSVPLIEAPAVWDSLGLGATGEGVDIGIIDTGIDYIHTGFGGPGTEAAYDANDTTGIADTYNGAPLFPSAKVVGGYDFAGDAYTGDNVPMPDLDPMDCDGHGSHVAGTAAGFGVNADGTTYTGAYDGNVPFNSMRIGPGVAPRANLYALRVFGCDGSTNVTDAAIEWATDPNGDGNFADHLDVINMSLGSDYGGVNDTSAIASDRAAELGVIIVAAAGNAGDSYYIAGSPSVATRAISTASSVDAVDVVDGFSVTSTSLNGLQPATFSALYSWETSAPTSGALVYVAGYNGCAVATPAQAALIAGKVLLIDWAAAGSSVSECGSITRANNAQTAGAIGLVIASGQIYFDGSINGNAGIPAVYTTRTVGDALKTALAGAVTIRFDYAYRNSVRAVDESFTDTLSDFSSRGPRRGDSWLKPDLTMPGQSIFSVATDTGNEGTNISGTSMATPHAAGMMALLRELNPSWTVEELKALAMNTATDDLFTGTSSTPPMYGPGRVGPGRGNAREAAMSQVVAYNETDDGAVSVSFGSIEVAPRLTLTRSKTITVVNKGSAQASYALTYVPRVDSPGVTFTLSPTSVDLAPGASASVVVTLTADPTQMKRSVRDSSVAAFQLEEERHWLGEEAGFVELAGPISSPNIGQAALRTTQRLRVPVHAAPRLAAEMGTNLDSLILPEGTGTLSFTLEGDGVDTDPMAMPGTPAEDLSIVSIFELQEHSPRTTAFDAPEAAADIQYVGVASDYAAMGDDLAKTNVGFGISTYADNTLGSWYDTQFEVYIDTDSSGLGENFAGAEFVLFNPDLGWLTDNDPNDVYVSALLDLSNGTFASLHYTNGLNSDYNTNLLNNNVLMLETDADSLGLTAGNTRINYAVLSYSSETGYSQVDATREMSFDIVNPGVSTPEYLYLDLPDPEPIDLRYNTAAFEASASRGLLLLHHHNSAAFGRAEAVLAPVDLGVAFSSPSQQPDGKVTYTATVTNSSPRPADNVVVTMPLPAGVTLAGSAVASEGPCFATGGLAVCNLGTVAENGSSLFSMTLAAAAAGNYELVATVYGSAGDPAVANNTTLVPMLVPGLTVAESGGSTVVVEGGATDSYTVALAAQPTGDVTITATPSATLDLGAGAGKPVTLTFTAANWDDAQTVTVRAASRLAAGGTTQGTIAHTVTGGGYDNLSVPSLSVTIANKFYVNLPLIRR